MCVLVRSSPAGSWSGLLWVIRWSPLSCNQKHNLSFHVLVFLFFFYHHTQTHSHAHKHTLSHGPSHTQTERLRETKVERGSRLSVLPPIKATEFGGTGGCDRVVGWLLCGSSFSLGLAVCFCCRLVLCSKSGSGRQTIYSLYH